MFRRHGRRLVERTKGPWFLGIVLSVLGSAAIAAESPSAMPVTASGQCPAPDAVWQELAKLFPPQELMARLHSVDGTDGTIRVDDLGAAFRVSLLGNTRQYREESRDCGRRARTSALFAALVLDPTAMLDSSPPPPEPPAPPPAAPPAPLVSPPPPPVAPTPSAALLRIEGGPTVLAGLDGAQTTSWGATLKVSAGRGFLAPVVAVSGFLPSESSAGGVRLRQWRLPVELGIRATLPGGTLDWFGEAGLAFAVMRARALNVLAARAATGFELGLKAGLGARLGGARGLSPFAVLEVELVPDPPSVFALPAGAVGPLPHVWLGASAGVTWGMR